MPKISELSAIISLSANDLLTVVHSGVNYKITYANLLGATLTNIASLGTAADKMIYTTAEDTWAEAAITSFGRSLIDDANAAAALSTLGLDADLATFALPANTTIANAAAGYTLTANSVALAVEADSSLNQNLKTTASPTFATAKLTNLTDGYIPYHVSDTSGLTDSPIRTNGTQISIGAAPSTSYNFYHYGTYSDYTSEIFHFSARAYPTCTTTGTARTFYTGGFYSHPIVPTDGNNTGSVISLIVSSFRNNVSAGTDDNGTLTGLRALSLHYGHYNTNTSSTPTTTNVYGICMSPCYATGTIGNLFDIYIASPTTGGTVSGTHYGIYQQSTSSKNYFGGSVGIGTLTIDHALCVAGSSTSGVKIVGETYNTTIIGNIESHPVTSAPGGRIIGPSSRNLHIEINGNGSTDRFSVITDPSNESSADTEVFFVNNLGCVGIGYNIGAVDANCTYALAIKSGTAPSQNPTDVIQLYSADVGAVAGKAGLHLRGETGGIFAIRPETGTTQVFTYQNDSLADDGTVDLPDATSGMVFVSCNAESGMWVVKSDGSVAKACGTTNTDVADTDGKLDVFDNGTYARVRNRLGATGVIRIIYYYK